MRILELALRSASKVLTESLEFDILKLPNGR